MAKINKSTQEIERRWLLKEIPKEINLKNLSFTEISQSYLSKKPVIRLRSHDKKEFVLCIKTQGDKKSLARPETEVAISQKEYQSLMRKSITEPIVKKRYFFKYKKLTIELDVFFGYLSGLIVIEAEFKSEKQADKYYNDIKIACKEIGENPSVGKNYTDISEQLLGFKSGKHILFYHQISADEIEVIRILHESMDLKNRISE